MRKPHSIIRLMMLIISVFSTFLLTGCVTTTTNNVMSAPHTPSPTIGISWMENRNQKHSDNLLAYVDAVLAAGGKPVLLPMIANRTEANRLVRSLDGLVLTGGEDISPAMYGEDPKAKLGTINPARDKSDALLVAAALGAKLPMLATGRGMQLLNVFEGGSLYQDIPSQIGTKVTHQADTPHFASHNIRIVRGSLLSELLRTDHLQVNSWHHQSVKTVGKDLAIIAMAHDGVVEALQKVHAPFVLGVQFHPEWLYVNGDRQFLAVYKALVAYAKKYH